jgi:glutaminase
MTERDELQEILDAALGTEIKNGSRLEELGFERNEVGQFKAVNCTVTLYSSCGEWEVDIKLPNGSAIGGDVPKLLGRTAAEIAKVRQA